MISRFTFAVLLITGLFFPVTTHGAEINHWESVVLAGDTWHYFVGTSNGAPVGWQNLGFDDSGWLQGPGGIGYADGDDATVISSDTIPTALYVRRVFTIADTADIELALLNMDYDDGFVAWINGVEVARANLGTMGDYPAYNTNAGDHEAVMFQGQNPASFVISRSAFKSCMVNGSNVLAIQVNNLSNTSSDMSCIPFLSVAMKTEGLTYHPVPVWFYPPDLGYNGSTLPLIMINTNGGYLQQEVKTMVDMGIIDNGPENVNHTTDAWNHFNGMAGMEIRGSSSAGFPKLNYGIELWKGYEQDTSMSLLGMPKESDWVLHGPYSDKSLLRNFLAYNLARRMGSYASRTRLCELYINDIYQGVYVLLERIKRDSARVNISKLNPEDVTGDQLTGGYIVKIDRSATDYTDGWFSPYIGTGTGNQGPFFAYVYPRRDEILPIQANYIRNKITNFEETLRGPYWLDSYVGYRSYIDISSFVDYFIMIELSKNVDGYRLSTFMHKDRDGKDGRIKMGPAWDYDLAYGNADYLDASNTQGWSYPIPADGWGNPFWWNRFMSDPYFRNFLYCRWHDFRQGVLSDESITALIDSAVTVLGPAIDRNFTRWDIHGTYIWPNAYVGNTFEQDLNYMKNWIISRAAWIDQNVPGTECMSSIEDHPQQLSFTMRAYPNPSIGSFNLEIQNERAEQLSVEIYSGTGQLVYGRDIGREPIFSERIHLDPGAYLVRVKGNSGMDAAKIVVQ
jgi:hypothetical protein